MIQHLTKEELRELIAAEIEVANSNTEDIYYMPAGTYTAQDVHEYKSTIRLNYFEHNEKWQSLTKIMKINGGWFSTPIGNLYNLINEHEKAAGLTPHVWTRTERRRPKLEFYLTFPPKNFVDELYRQEKFDGSPLSAIAISLKRGTLHWASSDGINGKQTFEESIPALPELIAESADIFRFLPYQYKYIYGRCKVSLRYNNRALKRPEDPNNPFKISCTIENEQGQFVSSTFVW